MIKKAILRKSVDSDHEEYEKYKELQIKVDDGFERLLQAARNDNKLVNWTATEKYIANTVINFQVNKQKLFCLATVDRLALMR